jgi:hypothetical protein
VHRRRVLDRRPVLAATHLEAAVAHFAFDEQIRRLDSKWLQEVHTTQCCRSCCPSHLEVARAWEDDAALHHVVSNEGVQRARSRRAKDGSAV